MRKQDRVVVWPAYFDQTKTRKDGRRVSKSIAVIAPRVNELKEAADALKLECEVVADVGYSKTPWVKTGTLLVEKKGTKSQTLTMLARQIVKSRSAVKQVQN